MSFVYDERMRPDATVYPWTDVTAAEDIERQIDLIPEARECYDAEEPRIAVTTKAQAKAFAREVNPNRLLRNADVFPNYGEINIVWQYENKKLKLIIPASYPTQAASIYHGVMSAGSVQNAAVEANAYPQMLQNWLEWLYQGE